MKDRLKTMADLFKALSDKNRLVLIKLLASSPEETLCVTDIAKTLKISQPAASQHIKVLKNISILEENKKGFRVYYSINNDVLKVYKSGVDELFVKAFEKCPHDFACSECEFNNECR